MATQQVPTWPRCGVSVAIFRNDAVLLIKRGKPPLKGLWSLPGGHVEPGERAREAALRELAEETGVAARIDGLADVIDVLQAPDGVLVSHYVIAVFYGRWLGGEPIAASDAADARFVRVQDVVNLSTTDGAPKVITTAWRLANALPVAP